MLLKKSKKAIVLLITLFFISAISVLILQNLKDSEGFFKVVNTNMSLTQTQVTIKNVNDEIMGFFSKNNNKDEVIKQLPVVLPLSLHDDVNVQINIEEYFVEEYIYVDDLNLSTMTDDFIDSVDYRAVFLEILGKNKKLLNGERFSSKQQINKIIDEYIAQTRSDRILEIKDIFDYGKYDNNESTYLKCSYELDISSVKSIVNMVFKVGDTNTTKFEFYFRNSDD